MNVIEAVTWNFRLYGIQIEFHKDTRITVDELENISKTIELIGSGSNITASEFNRYEADIVEDRYHQHSRMMNMFWATRLGPDSPKTIIDQQISSELPFG